jgi:hypothetical protein
MRSDCRQAVADDLGYMQARRTSTTGQFHLRDLQLTKMNADKIARAIRTEYATRNDNVHTVIGARAALYSVGLRLAREFEKDQPRFDCDAFLEACDILTTGDKRKSKEPCWQKSHRAARHIGG